MKIIVFTLGDYGYSMLWTRDGDTWVRVNRSPLSLGQKNQFLTQLMEPGAEVLEVADIHCKIPAELKNPRTKII